MLCSSECVCVFADQFVCVDLIVFAVRAGKLVCVINSFLTASGVKSGRRRYRVKDMEIQ